MSVEVQGNLDIRGVLGLEEGVRAGFRVSNEVPVRTSMSVARA